MGITFISNWFPFSSKRILFETCGKAEGAIAWCLVRRIPAVPDQHTFPYCSLLDRDIPEVTVRYKDLTIEVDAAVGFSDTPSLWNSFIALVNWLLLRSGASRRSVRVFEGVSGMLCPVRCVEGRLSFSLWQTQTGHWKLS